MLKFYEKGNNRKPLFFHFSTIWKIMEQYTNKFYP